MHVGSIAVGLIIDPMALVDISVCVIELTKAVCFVRFPLSFILDALRPSLDARTVPQAILQVAAVDLPVSND